MVSSERVSGAASLDRIDSDSAGPRGECQGAWLGSHGAGRGDLRAEKTHLAQFTISPQFDLFIPISFFSCALDGGTYHLMNDFLVLCWIHGLLYVMGV